MIKKNRKLGVIAPPLIADEVHEATQLFHLKVDIYVK